MRKHIIWCILLFIISLHAQTDNSVGTPFMVSVSNSIYDYSDNTIIIVLTPEYSTVGAVVNRPPLNLGDIKIQEIENIFPITNQKAIETLHSRGLQYQAIYKIILPTHDKDKVIEVIQILKQIEGVESASPNYYYPAVVTPDDTDYEQQWGLHGVHGIQAPEAWDINTGSVNVRVGIVDSGISNHPELTQNLTTGWDFVNNNDNTDDPHGHGTHITGIIGAIGNNAQGIAGINWNTTLVPLQVYQYHNETGVYMNGAAIISAISYATNTWGTAEQISVLNYSVDGYGNDTLTKTAVSNYPGLFLWAAGNSNRNVDPDIAAFGSFDLPNLIAVGSITEAGERSSFSNFSASNQNVHIYAPGTSIYSTMINGTYASWSGTSMSTPFAVGVAGLLLSRNPTLTAQDLKTIITSCYTPLSITTPLGEQTVKRLNAFLAISGAGFLPPENLTWQVSGESIVLSWTAPVNTSPTGYNIYRGASDTPLNPTPITSQSYTDYTVTLGFIYVYTARAVYPEAESSSSLSAIVNMNAPIYTFENAIAGDWVLVNGSQTNKWMVGNATASDGNYSLYISNDNDANTYSLNSASTVHFYRDIRFTRANENNITFDLQVGGEPLADFLRVYLCETSINPVAGSYPSGLLLGEYCFTNTWSPKLISLPTQQVNTIKRLVFTWRNNGSRGVQPPAAVDNISFNDDGPHFNIDIGIWSFAEQEIGTASPAQPFTITNTGNGVLTIDSIALTGEYTADFVLSANDLPVNINAGTSYTFTVSFAPLHYPGLRTANIRVYHNSYNSPAVLSLSGRGVGSVSLPLSELFNYGDFPPTSPDWLSIDKGQDQIGWMPNNETAYSDNYGYYPAMQTDSWLITPRFTFEAGITYTIRWDNMVTCVGGLTDIFSVYLMSSVNPDIDCIDDAPGNSTIFSAINIPSWQMNTHTFIPTENMDRYIGFRHHSSDFSVVQIDNVFVFGTVDHDIGILQFTGSNTFTSNSTFEVTLYNFGSNAVPAGAYSISFKYLDTLGVMHPLGVPITDTPAIAIGETAQINITDTSEWDFAVTERTELNLYAEVVYPPDDTPSNNISHALPIVAFGPVAVIDLMTGAGTISHPAIPIHFYYQYSHSQCLYTASDMGGVANRGKMVRMILRLNNYNLSQTLPVQIYLANVPANMMVLDRWYETPYWVKVYDAYLPVGDDIWGTVDVDLDFGTGNGTEDFVYEGGGLIVMTNKNGGQTSVVPSNWYVRQSDVLRSVARMTNDPNQFNYSYISRYPQVIFYVQRYTSEADETRPVFGGLSGNYPNPFNPSTTISFSLDREGFVALDVYNVRGQKVRSLVSGVYGAGVHKVVWNGVSDDGRSVGSGIYFYRMVSGEYVGVKKMVLIK